MKKISFIFERVIFFVCGLFLLSFLILIRFLDLDISNVVGVLCCSFGSIIFFIISFTYHITYDNESITIYLCFFKRTYLFKDFKNVYVFMYRLYLVTFFDSRTIALPGIGEKKKLTLLFKTIKESQPSLEVFE